MNFNTWARKARLLAGVTALALAPLASAQAAYPERAIRLLVPFPAGGGGDLMARGVAQKMGQILNQQIVIENRGGAAGTIAADAAAKAAPDGYTLFFGSVSTHAIAPAHYPNLNYDPIKDFVPISRTHVNPRVLVVSNKLPVNSMQELIELAKSNPGKLTYASAGAGSTGHLAGALFAMSTGIDMLHIPYKGTAQVLPDLMEGRVDLTFDSYSVYEGQIAAGNLRALGVASPERISVLPDTPTVAETVKPGFDVSNWMGFFAPAGVSPEIIATLHKAIEQAMADEELRQQLQRLGIVPGSTTPEQFSELLAQEVPRWEEVVKSALKDSK